MTPSVASRWCRKFAKNPNGFDLPNAEKPRPAWDDDDEDEESDWEYPMRRQEREEELRYGGRSVRVDE